MKWNRAVRLSGFLGATVCGVCLAKTCLKSDGIFESVGAQSENPVQIEGEQKSKLTDLTLKQVHVYFRHGARTPIHVTPGLEEVSFSRLTLCFSVTFSRCFVTPTATVESYPVVVSGVRVTCSHSRF